MSVKIILGGIGSGKTRYCIDDIRKIHDADPGRRCIVLVPSQFSHETEKLIVDSFGGTGLNNISVTSFEKLAREMTDMRRRLAAPGKQAITARAVKLALEELDRDKYDGRLMSSANKRGFVEIASSLISEMHRYVISSSDLRSKADEMKECILKQKLEITALIYDKYDGLLKAADYIDSDEDLIRLSEVVGKCFGPDASVWIDKFDELLPQQLAVVKAIIDSGAEVTITFTYNGDDTYYGTVETISAISEYTPVEKIVIAGSMRHIKFAPDLRFLFSTWFDRSRFTGRVDNAEVFEARDAYTEVEHTACKILDLVREDNYRFRDIAVICGNQDIYSHIIEAVFDEYEIPYYSDERISIAEHPIAMQILALFDIVENNWDYLSMFEYLRAGFVYTKDGGKYKRISDDEIDKLEDYVLKFGIRGKKMWCSEWTNSRRSMIDEALENDVNETDVSEIDALRRVVIAPISGYCEGAKKAATVSEHCCILYEFLEKIDLYQGLKAELLSMAMNRATADAQRFGQIWNLVLDILDQMNTALGAEEVTVEEFGELMRAAMSKCSIRTIPSGVDRVFIGTVEKNRSVNTNVIFAIGAVSGTFPTDTHTEGFLSNSDREMLSEMGIELAPTTTLKTKKSANGVYKALSSASDRLYISYPIQTPDGHSCRPSQIVLDICSKLKNIKRSDDIILTPGNAMAFYISSPAATLHKLLINRRADPIWEYVNEWFDENGHWRNKLFTVRHTKERYTNRVIELDPQLAKVLYKGPIYYSPTHLNTYSRCPFKNFMQYGIGAKEREEFEITAADAGTYAHEIIRRFCEEIDNGAGWGEITDDICTDLIKKIVNDTIKNIRESEFYERERMADILRRMGSTVEEVSKTVRMSIVSGGFMPCAYEKKVKVELAHDIGIVGTIDRVDVCSHDGVNEYRVIDYKTGKQGFSVADICAGLDMQPVIYSLAIAKNDPKGVIAGMYYSKVRNDYSHIETTSYLSTAQNELKKNTMLDGATFVETTPDGEPLPESLDRIESERKRLEGSIFFDMKKKKGSKTEYEQIVLGKNLHSRAAGGRLMDEVRDKIMEMDKDIRRGKIDLKPLKTGQSSVCQYCEYSPICKFDENCKHEWSVTEKDKEAWGRLEDEA